MKLALKLEAGKTYRTRDGRHEVTVRSRRANERAHQQEFTFRSDDMPGSRDSWRDDGTYEAHGQSPLDLIEEVTPAPEQPKPDAIPRADLIRAVLDGKVVQYLDGARAIHKNCKGSRADVIRALLAYPDYDYRIKPEPLVAWAAMNGRYIVGHEDEQCARSAILMEHRAGGRGWKILRIESDRETKAVISCTTEEV